MSDVNGADAPGGATPVDAGADDTSFALGADFENFDEEIEIPAEGSTEPTPGGQGGQTPPQPQPTPAGQTPQGQTPPATAPTPGTPSAGQQPPAQPQGGSVQPQAATAQPATGEPRGPMSPGELATALGRSRDTLIDALAQQKFGLSPAEVQALEVDAVGVLPKIMARVYYEATVNGLQQLNNMVPRMVEHVVSERIAETQAEDAFRSEWPTIDMSNRQHAQAVNHFANSFRQMNPGASRADAIKFVGTAVTQLLSLPLPQRNAAPSAPRGGSPQPRRTAAPFAPAAGGRAAPPAGTPPAQESPFAGLGVDFDG